MFGIPLKPLLYVGLAIAVMGFARWAYSAVYNSGFGAAQIQFQQMAIEQQNDAIEAARLRWEADQEAAGKQIVVEERIVERIKIVREEIPMVVERIVEITPECSDLGPDFLGLYNAAINASNSGSAGSPDTEPSPDEALRPDGGSGFGATNRDFAYAYGEYGEGGNVRVAP